MQFGFNLDLTSYGIEMMFKILIYLLYFVFLLTILQILHPPFYSSHPMADIFYEQTENQGTLKTWRQVQTKIEMVSFEFELALDFYPPLETLLQFQFSSS